MTERVDELMLGCVNLATALSLGFERALYGVLCLSCIVCHNEKSTEREKDEYKPIMRDKESGRDEDQQIKRDKRETNAEPGRYTGTIL